MIWTIGSRYIGGMIWIFDPEHDYGLDYRTWNWGCTIIAHKLVQHEDGSLGVSPTESLEKAFTISQTVKVENLLGDWEISDSRILGLGENGYAAALGTQIPRQCCLKMTIAYHGSPSDFGLALQVDEKFDFGYYLMFEPAYNRIQFRSGLRMYETGGQMFPYAVEMERPLKLEEGKDYELELYIQDSIGLLYVDHDLAFGMRMYNYQDRKLGFYVFDGSVEVKNVRIWTEGEKGI